MTAMFKDKYENKGSSVPFGEVKGQLGLSPEYEEPSGIPDIDYSAIVTKAAQAEPEPLPEEDKEYKGQQLQQLTKAEDVELWEQPKDVTSKYAPNGELEELPVYDETTLSKLFVIKLRDIARYDEENGRWYLLGDNKSWQLQADIGQVRNKATEAMSEIFEKLQLEEWTTKDKEGAPKFNMAKWRATERQLKNKRKISDVLALASDSADMRTPASAFDQNPYELNCPSGIIDLSTGVRRDRTKYDYVSQMTSLDPAEGTPTRFLQMIEEGTGSTELVNFLQLALGETLLGGQQGQHFYYLRGAARSGKGTLFNIIEKVLNSDYTANLDKSTILDTPFHKHEETLAVLRGKRMAIVNEIKQGDRLDTARVKELTGGDTITASFKAGHRFEFKPDFTLWMQGNFDFEIPSDDAGLWERMKVIQYKNTKPAEERIAHLDDKLIAEEGPQILQWMIEGAVKLFTEGMFIPPEVQEATDEYQSEQDSVAKWFQSGEVIKSKDSKVRRSSVNDSFKKYCKFNDLPAVGPKYLKDALQDRYGVTEYKSDGVWYYQGITGRYI